MTGVVPSVLREAGEGVGGDGEAVAALVLRMPGVALDPGETEPEAGRQGVELRPEVVVLLAFPALRDRFDHVGGVAEHLHLGPFPFDRFQPLDHRQQFHAVVGGAGKAARELFARVAADEHCAPTAGTRVAAGCAVGVEVYGRPSCHCMQK